MEPKKNSSVGLFLGCIVWFAVFGILLSCLIPMAIFGGLLSGFLASDPVAKTVGPLLCPQATTPYIHTFETTSIGENGVEYPSTGIEMLCRQVDGTSVEPLVDYQDAWIWILVIAAILVSAVIAIFVAGPVGILINRLLDRLRGKGAEFG
ncbi:MAG: hypothetical protein AB1649_16185 [Chloroflexota bacterium]